MDTLSLEPKVQGPGGRPEAEGGQYTNFWNSDQLLEFTAKNQHDSLQIFLVNFPVDCGLDFQ